jgi:hypothetical protein
MENEYMSTNCPVKYHEKGGALFPLGCLLWRKGKQVLLYPLDRAEVKSVPMVPRDQRKERPILVSLPPIGGKRSIEGSSVLGSLLYDKNGYYEKGEQNGN